MEGAPNQHTYAGINPPTEKLVLVKVTALPISARVSSELNISPRTLEISPPLLSSAARVSAAPSQRSLLMLLPDAGWKV